MTRVWPALGGLRVSRSRDVGWQRPLSVGLVGNAAEILAQPDVDGALVGGASLDPDAFAQIVAAASA